MKIGDKVEIIGNSTRHRFEVGQQVYAVKTGDAVVNFNQLRVSVNKTCDESFYHCDCCWIVGQKDVKEMDMLKVGDKAIVVGTSYGHRFNIGSVVEIIEVRQNGDYEAKGISKYVNAVINQTLRGEDLKKMKFRVGQKIRYNNGKKWSNVDYVVTIEKIESDKIWFKETSSWYSPSDAEKYLEVVQEIPSLKGFRPFNEKELQLFEKKCERDGFQYLVSQQKNYKVRYTIKGNFTICNVITEQGEVCNGVSKRNPKDRFNKGIGERIAFANVWD